MGDTLFLVGCSAFSLINWLPSNKSHLPRSKHRRNCACYLFYFCARWLAKFLYLTCACSGRILFLCTVRKGTKGVTYCGYAQVVLAHSAGDGFT